MIKILLILTALFLTACVNKHGVSAKYYSDCQEYYDLQGFYHKDCGKDDIVTYKTMQKEIKETSSKIIDKFTGKKEKEEVPPNVW